MQLLQDQLVWDSHACMPMRWNDPSFLPRLADCRAAGVDVISLNIGYGELGIEHHVRMIAAFRHWVQARPDEYLLAGSLADIDAARANGRLAILFDMEGTRGIADQLSMIQLYYDLGVRWMLMAYNRRNLVGAGVHDLEGPFGLSAYGAEVVAEMQRVGMIVCCSHTHPDTVADVLAVTSRPIIFSHSNASALWPHKRNISDDLIRGCAETGGVVCATGVGAFLGAPDAHLPAAFADHLLHMVSVAGPAHVGIGLDHVFDRSDLAEALATMRHTFPDDPAYATVPDFLPHSALPEVVARLVEAGLTDAEIAGILGGNLRRVAEACWARQA